LESDGSQLLGDWKDDGNDPSAAQEVKNAEYLNFDMEQLKELIKK
jgi:hypothetical protein